MSPFVFKNLKIVFIDNDYLECIIIQKLNYQLYFVMLYTEFVKLFYIAY